MNQLTNTNQLSAVAGIEDDDVLELRTESERVQNMMFQIALQSRIRQSVLESMHSKISLLAYTIWQREGSPLTGNSTNNWFEAKKIIESETMYPSNK